MHLALVRATYDLIEVNGLTHVATVSMPTGIDPERFKPGDPVSVRARLGLGEKFTIGIVATCAVGRDIDVFRSIASRAA